MYAFLHWMLCIASEWARCSFIFFKLKIDSSFIQEIPTTISSLSALPGSPFSFLFPLIHPLSVSSSDKSRPPIDNSHIGQNKYILRQGKSSHVEDKQGNQLGGKSLKQAKESEIHPLPHVAYFKCFYLWFSAEVEFLPWISILVHRDVLSLKWGDSRLGVPKSFALYFLLYSLALDVASKQYGLFWLNDNFHFLLCLPKWMASESCRIFPLNLNSGFSVWAFPVFSQDFS